MSFKALVELRHTIISARDSDHLWRFPGRFNLYKAVFHAHGYRGGREPVFAQTAYISNDKQEPRATDAIRFTLARLSRE
jgi:hypothetical protein